MFMRVLQIMATTRATRHTKMVIPPRKLKMTETVGEGVRDAVFIKSNDDWPSPMILSFVCFTSSFSDKMWM